MSAAPERGGLLPDELPLGPAGLVEERSQEELARRDAVPDRPRRRRPGRRLHRDRRLRDDGGPTDGPWRVTIPEVDPREFDGTVRTELATGEVAGRETTSAIVDRVGALAAVNGGFFTIDGSRNVPGPWQRLHLRQRA
ncbi:hypothetical protein [Jiangella rhizosphaerae]|uniref:hypothetical protein n=1 Tax=Jiangella rhizosphaerae TaxID=2293569 RepID=UPI0013144975|nr:hypothetical protein [Jiangella rhizosphaerae]